MNAQRASRVWAQRSFANDLLVPVSLLYAAATSMRRWLYRRGVLKSTALAVPTIVIGNIVVGGTGKTPLVIALARRLGAAGFTPGVISRGYGGSHARLSASWHEVMSDDAALFGDEIVLIRAATGLPCAVGASRLSAGQGLLSAHPEIDVMLCDDGLQHYGLARDIELAVFDQRGIGNGRLLPSGPLREPLLRLEGLDAIVVNGSRSTARPAFAKALDTPVYPMQLKAHAAHPLRAPGLARDLVSFKGQRVTAAAGIGDPERFFSMLESFGIVVERRALPDHFAYSLRFFRDQPGPIIMITEKDAVKCQQIDDDRIWVVPVHADLDAALEQFILEKLRAPR